MLFIKIIYSKHKQTATLDINGENTVQLNAKVIPSNANKNTEITLDRNIIIFDLNKTTTSQITATVTPADATEKIQWTSSDTDVAIINDTGLVTAKSAGTATITVKNANGTKSAICEVNVIEGQGYLLGSGNTDSSK